MSAMFKWMLAISYDSDGWRTDSRFSHGPPPYTRTPVDFFWGLFIGAMVIAVSWYILNVTSKRRR